ncbi:beta-crystallin B1-like [Polypterus senegalus]|nr:beta-crystallin B1-like [Polypterus senegalus]
MSAITLYKNNDLTGENSKFIDDNFDLSPYGYDRKMGSMSVQGNPWVTYSEAQFKGDENLYTKGSYKDITDDAKFMSMKLIKDLKSPRITLFKKTGFVDEHIELDEHTTLPLGYQVASYKVHSGAWCLFEFQGNTGKKHVAFKGENVADCHSIDFDNYPASLEPVKP